MKWINAIKVRSHHAISLLFLLFVFYVGLNPLPQTIVSTLSLVGDSRSLQQYIRETDDQYKTMLSFEKDAPILQNKGTYINLNGFMAKILGQPMLNDCLKLTNGHLARIHPTQTSNSEIEAVSQNISTLCSYQLNQGKHFLFVLTPSQISKYENYLPTGYVDSTNDTADRLLSYLDQFGVPYLDLRESLYADGLSHADAFYITDHHWTSETGFWAYGKILEKLAFLSAVDSVDAFYVDPENYNFTTYHNVFLGSSGKRTGIYFAGVDDFSLITPKFYTDIHVDIPSTGESFQGPYEYSTNMFYPENAFSNINYFSFNPYDLYGRSDTPPAFRTNKGAPHEESFLLIGDSFGNVPFSLLSIYAQKTCELDMRIFDEDFSSLISGFNPDIVVLMVNTSICLDDNSKYPFFTDNRQK